MVQNSEYWYLSQAEINDNKNTKSEQAREGTRDKTQEVKTRNDDIDVYPCETTLAI